MAKQLTQFECQECGGTFPRWQGQCSQCNAWNSLVEIQVEKRPTADKGKPKSTPTQMSKVEPEHLTRLPTQISQLDDLLGGGFVRGSVTLLGGEPGIGKSTLSLQLAQSIARQGHKVLVISGEESNDQIHLRSKRLGENPESLWVYAQTNMVEIQNTLTTMQPDFVILDSIQVVYHPDLTALPGSVSQVRHCANQWVSWIKEHHCVGILIGHINKDGHLAGPKVLEHMVDVILYLEGERNQQFRICRCYKNRYASTQEIVIFEMLETGLSPVGRPSELFIDKSTLSNPGSMIAAILEGNRPILVEVQALVVTTGFGMAKRNVVGVNNHRAMLMIATLEKMCGFTLSNQDIFLNIIGGLKVAEPAMDLAIVLSIISSYKNCTNTKKVAAIGEVGLTGEIRSVPDLKRRLQELKIMGFMSCYVPHNSEVDESIGITVFPMQHIKEVITHFLANHEQTTYA